MDAPNVLKYREIDPIGDKIMVRPLKAEKMTKGGLYIPDSAKRPPLMGIVLAAGPGRPVENPLPSWLASSFQVLFEWLRAIISVFVKKDLGDIPTTSDSVSFIRNPVKAGDKILFHRFSGTEINDTDENTVILMTMDDVLAIIDPGVGHCVCKVCEAQNDNTKKLAEATEVPNA